MNITFLAIDENYNRQKRRPTTIKINETEDQQNASADENFSLKVHSQV